MTFAHVLPMTTGELCTSPCPEAVAAVFIRAADEENGARLLATAFGLTPAETRVLESLLTGRTLAETADYLGSATSTAKHISTAHSKRQASPARRG